MSSPKIHYMEQQTDPWYEIKKLFPFSASKAQAIASMGKGLETLVKEALIKKYSAQNPDRFEGGHIERGNEEEPDIRSIYELETGSTVEEVGFITNEDISSMGGVSPDGLVGDDGMTEFKSLSDKVYYDKLMEISKKGDFKIDSSYDWQCQMQLLFSGRKWNDHCLYNPNFKRSILIQRIYPDLVKQEKIVRGLAFAVKLYREEEAHIKKALKIK